VRLSTRLFGAALALVASAAVAQGGGIDEFEKRRRWAAEKTVPDLQNMVQARVDRLMAALPAEERNKVLPVEVEVGFHPAAFLCVSETFVQGGATRRVVWISAETVTTIFKIAGATALTVLDPDRGDKWLRSYLLYLRKLPDGAIMVDPLRASGYVDAHGKWKAGASEAEEFQRQTGNVAEAILMFLLAHEIAHFVEPRAARSTSESDEAHERRVRADEARADAFAIELLASIERSTVGADDRPTFYLKGAPMLFLSWVLVLQASRHPVGPGTHPADHVRALKASEMIEARIGTFGLTKKAEQEVRRAAKETRDEMAQIAADPALFFSRLDTEASAVTLDSLRLK
jgi:hypothetical protein